MIRISPLVSEFPLKIEFEFDPTVYAPAIIKARGENIDPIALALYVAEHNSKSPKELHDKYLAPVIKATPRPADPDPDFLNNKAGEFYNVYWSALNWLLANGVAVPQWEDNANEKVKHGWRNVARKSMGYAPVPYVEPE